jgi:deoxyribodipyrimidine photo-lyase
MPAPVQDLAGCRIGQDYPAPIVDEKSALRAAKERMYGLRQQEVARQEASAVQARHGSRKSGLPPTAGRGGRVRRKQVPAVPATAPAQGDLFA